MYRRESWTIKKGWAPKNWCFQILMLKKTLEKKKKRLWRVPWTARRSNKSITKEINPEYSLKGLMLKLKLSYFGYLMQRANPLEKTLMLRKIGCRRKRGNKRWDGYIASSTQQTWIWANSGKQWRTEEPSVLQSMRKERVRQDLETEKQQQSGNFRMIFLSYHKESHRAGSPEGSALDRCEWVGHLLCMWVSGPFQKVAHNIAGRLSDTVSFLGANCAFSWWLGRLVSFHGFIMDVFQKGVGIHSWQCGKASWLYDEAEQFQLGMLGEKE